MDDRVCSALLLLIPIVPAVAQPLPEGVVARIAPAKGEPAFTGRIWTALSPDGQTVAVTDEAGRLDLWEIAGKRFKTLRTGGPKGVSPRTPRWSPDGRWLYASHADGVAVWDVTKPGEPRVLASGLKSGEVRRIAVSPDGRFVVGGAPSPMMICWDADTGHVRWRADYDGPIGVSADGRFVVRSYFGQRFDFMDATTGKEASSFGPPSIACTPTFGDNFAFSPDGRQIAVGIGTFVSVRDAVSGGKVWEKRVGLLPLEPLVFSPDGHWLATAGMGATVIIWDAATGEKLRELESHGLILTSIDLTPDGHHILTASTDGTALLRELAPTEPPPADFWSALRSDDGAETYAAMWALARDTKGPAVLRTHLPAVPRLSATDLDRLISDLDANRHAVRERATRSLAEQGRAALAAFRAALARGQSPEASARLEKLIQANSGELTPTEIVHRRAVKAMSLAGTPEARALLAEWADGAPGAVLTDAARAILARR
jgi:hypothetical protein